MAAPAPVPTPASPPESKPAPADARSLAEALIARTALFFITPDGGLIVKLANGGRLTPGERDLIRRFKAELVDLVEPEPIPAPTPRDDDAERAKRRGFLLRSIIACLQRGPQPADRILETIGADGYGEREIREASALVPVVITHSDGREIWDMERYG